MRSNNIKLFFGAFDEMRQIESSFPVNILPIVVQSFKVINFRITILTLDIKWVQIAFVNVHVPIEDKDENEKDKFYYSLDSTLCEIPKICVQVILGDYNVQIGHEECFKPIIGDMYSVHQLSNDNGCRLIDLGRNLWVKSIMFPHKKIHRGTLR